jgi:hypothetical protein
LHLLTQAERRTATSRIASHRTSDDPKQSKKLLSGKAFNYLKRKKLSKQHAGLAVKTQLLGCQKACRDLPSTKAMLRLFFQATASIAFRGKV